MGTLLGMLDLPEDSPLRDLSKLNLPFHPPAVEFEKREAEEDDDSEDGVEVIEAKSLTLNE